MFTFQRPPYGRLLRVFVGMGPDSVLSETLLTWVQPFGIWFVMAVAVVAVKTCGRLSVHGRVWWEV